MNPQLLMMFWNAVVPKAPGRRMIVDLVDIWLGERSTSGNIVDTSTHAIPELRQEEVDWIRQMARIENYPGLAFALSCIPRMDAHIRTMIYNEDAMRATLTSMPPELSDVGNRPWLFVPGREFDRRRAEVLMLEAERYVKEFYPEVFVGIEGPVLQLVGWYVSGGASQLIINGDLASWCIVDTSIHHYMGSAVSMASQALSSLLDAHAYLTGHWGLPYALSWSSPYEFIQLGSDGVAVDREFMSLRQNVDEANDETGGQWLSASKIILQARQLGIQIMLSLHGEGAIYRYVMPNVGVGEDDDEYLPFAYFEWAERGHDGSGWVRIVIGTSDVWTVREAEYENVIDLNSPDVEVFYDVRFRVAEPRLKPKIACRVWLADKGPWSML